MSSLMPSNTTLLIGGAVCIGAGIFVRNIPVLKTMLFVPAIISIMAGIILIIIALMNMSSAFQGMCAYNSRTGRVGCDYHGQRPALMTWKARPRTRTENEMTTTNEAGGYHKIGDKYYKNKYMPGTRSMNKCPPRYEASINNTCTKRFPDGSSRTAPVLSCQQTPEYPIDYPETGTCRKECKGGYKWQDQRCVKVCHPSMEDFGTFCKSKTVSRTVTSSNPT